MNVVNLAPAMLAVIDTAQTVLDASGMADIEAAMRALEAALARLEVIP